MSIGKKDINTKANTGTKFLVLALLCLLPMLASNAFAEDVSRYNKSCPADDIPPLTNDANCAEGKSCESRPGCLDPVPLKPTSGVSSYFGPRTDPLKSRYEGKKPHGAIDFAAAIGTPIYAAEAGKVSADHVNEGGYGNRIQIVHNNGYETLYGHMHCYASYKGKKIKLGDNVKKGQVIGFVGNTGSSTGPHLHYEIRKAHTKDKKDPYEPEMQGVVCKIPDGFASASVPETTTDGNEAGGTVCTPASGEKNCAKMYPKEDTSQLHHKYESGGNAGAFNNCVAGDPGGCSYGSSQLACGKNTDSKGGTMGTYLKYVQKNQPDIWAKLSGGGSLQNVTDAACKAGSASHTAFVNTWKGLGSDAAFAASQEGFIKATHFDAANSSVSKKFGIDFNTRSPEAQMAMYSASVALGVGGASSYKGKDGEQHGLFATLQAQYGDKLNTLTDEELIAAMYKARDQFYATSSASIRESVQKRNANEGAEALESLKIRRAWEEEQKKPKDQQKTYEEVVQAATGKKACAGGESGAFNCTSSGSSGGAGGNGASGYESKTCAPSQYKASMGTCMFCPLFKVIFDTASRIAKLSFDKLSGAVILVVLTAWAIWIAMQILKFVSSLETKDAPTIIKTILNKSFIVLIAVLFLQADSTHFFSMAMEPIFNTGFKLAQLVLADEVCMEDFGVLKDGGLPPSMGNSILCTIAAIQAKLQETMSLGAASMCVGFWIKATFFIFPSLPYVITGMLIWAGAGIIILIFPFLMLDCIFQLTVACALLPAAIGAYPFELTKDYTKHVWNSFMYAMFNFVFLSILILILTTAIDEAVKESITASVNGDYDGTFMEVILNDLAWGGVAVLKIVFVLLMGWALLDEAAGFASSFSDSGFGSGKMGSQVGSMAAGGAKALGGKAWKGAKKAGGAIGETVKEHVNDKRRDMAMNNIKKNGVATDVKDADGKVIGTAYQLKTKSWFRGRDKVQTVEEGRNGRRIMTKEKDFGNGKIVKTKSDGYLKQTETSVNGQITSTDLAITTAGLKSIRNEDGTMNTTALDAALNNSAFSEEMIKTAAMRQYIEASFPQSKTKFLGTLDKAEISMTTDEKGNEVLQLREKGSDGSSQVMRMTMNGSARPLVELEKTNSDGDLVSHATDGMFNRIKKATVNMETGVEGKAVHNYGVSDYYAKRAPFPVNEDGEFAKIFENAGGTIFGKEDVERMTEQFIDDRTTGTAKPLKGFI